MADVKWIKITTDIFDDEKILLIESLPEADSIIVIWFKLLCLAGKMNNSGVFMMNDKIPYTDKMLATIFRRKESTVQLALQTFENFGMVEIIDGVITIPNWGKHQNLDQLEKKRVSQREYMRQYRERQKLLSCNANGKANGKANVSRPEEDIEEELELEKEKDVCITSNDVIRRTDVQQILEKWNTLGVAKVTKLVSGTNRDKMLKARIREYGVDTILQAIDSVKQSDFLMGKNKDGWTITFDWFIRPNNFPKVLDGNYNNKGSRKSTGRTEAVPSWCNDDLDKVERMLKIKTAGNNPEIAARAADLREKLGGDSA